MRLFSTALSLLLGTAALANPIPEPIGEVAEPVKRSSNGDIVYIARCVGSPDDWAIAAWYQNAANSQNVEYPNRISTVEWDEPGSRYYYMPDTNSDVVATLWNLNAAQWTQGGTATYDGVWYNCYRDNDRLLFWQWGNPCWSTFYCV